MRRIRSRLSARTPSLRYHHFRVCRLSYEGAVNLRLPELASIHAGQSRERAKSPTVECLLLIDRQLYA
jgi:hypothetical protein